MGQIPLVIFETLTMKLLLTLRFSLAGTSYEKYHDPMQLAGLQYGWAPP